MSALEWTEELSVGVEEIDDQHKEIIRRANSMVDAFGAGREEDHLIETMEFMARYVAEHFLLEEEYMVRFGYPDTKDHQAEHARISREVEGLQQKLHEGVTAGSKALIEELFILIGNLLLDHMQKTDRRMAKFLIGKVA